MLKKVITIYKQHISIKLTYYRYLNSIRQTITGGHIHIQPIDRLTLRLRLLQFMFSY